MKSSIYNRINDNNMIRYITEKGEVLTSNDYDLIEIDGAPFYYVFSKKRNRFLEWHFNRGYMCIKLIFNGNRRPYGLHRIIMSTLKPEEYFEGAQVNHIDEDKTNNKLSNLEWLSCKDNINHGTRNKRIAEAHTGKRRKQYKQRKGKPVIQLTKSGVKVAEYPLIDEAERQTGISHQNISKCCNSKLKSVGGYVWRYKES